MLSFYLGRVFSFLTGKAEFGLDFLFPNLLFVVFKFIDCLIGGIDILLLLDLDLDNDFELEEASTITKNSWLRSNPSSSI